VKVSIRVPRVIIFLIVMSSLTIPGRLGSLSLSLSLSLRIFIVILSRRRFPRLGKREREREKEREREGEREEGRTTEGSSLSLELFGSIISTPATFFLSRTLSGATRTRTVSLHHGCLATQESARVPN